MKLPMYRTAEPVGIEFECDGAQAAENASEPEEAATQPTEPFLLACPPVSAPVDDLKNEKSNSTLGDGSDLYEGQYFSNKKELKNKLTEIVLKGNFEFRTRKSNSCCG